MSLFSFSLIFNLWFAGTAKSTIRQVLSFFLLTITRSGCLAEIRWSVCISKSQRILGVSFFMTNCGLCINYLLAWLNFNFLHNYQWIAFPNQSYRILCLFYYYYYHCLRNSFFCGWFLNDSSLKLFSFKVYSTEVSIPNNLLLSLYLSQFIYWCVRNVTAYIGTYTKEIYTRAYAMHTYIGDYMRLCPSISMYWYLFVHAIQKSVIILSVCDRKRGWLKSKAT